MSSRPRKGDRGGPSYKADTYGHSDVGSVWAHQEGLDGSREVTGLTGVTTSRFRRSASLYFTEDDWEIHMNSRMIQFYNSLDTRKLHINPGSTQKHPPTFVSSISNTTSHSARFSFRGRKSGHLARPERKMVGANPTPARGPC